MLPIPVCGSQPVVFSGTGTELAQRRRSRFVVPEACRAIARLSGQCDPMLVSDYARRLLPDC